MSSRSITCSYCSCDIDIDAWDPSLATLNCPKCQRTVPILDEETDLPELPAAGGPSLGKIEVPGFELLDEVGRGAMGVVFRARQLSLDRTVAIKVLAPELASEQGFVARFDREAEVLSRLSHPHIVSILDRGQAGDISYIVMEFVERPGGQPAESLRDLIDSGPVSVDRTKSLIMQVADALQRAHEVGVVHRDLKPGNILVDSRGNARVVDFGIASVADRPAGAELTMVGKPIGTPDYMSPEQWRDGHSVDARSDIFSLGMILYELLTGRLPAGAFRPASELVDGLSQHWDLIITRSLQPEPERRFPTMTALLDELTVVDEVERASVSALDSVSCPACSETINLASGKCQSCGMDARKANAFHQNLAIGERHFTAVEDETALEDRLWMCEQALSAFQKAESECPNAEISKLVRDARRKSSSLALSSAREFVEQKGFAEARELLRRAAEYHGSDEVTELLRRIERTREKLLTEIQQLLSDGQINDAVSQLQRAERHFRGDAEFNALLNQHRSVAEQVTQSIEDQIPTLLKQRYFCAVLNLIEQLRESGAQVPELDRLRERVTKRLDRLQIAVEYAERAADKGEYDTAIELCGKVLTKCADHDEVLRIRDWAIQRREWISRVMQEVQTSVASNRWYEASYWLGTLTDQEGAREWFALARKRVEAALERLAAHSHLITFALFGCVVFQVSALLVPPIQDGLFGPLVGMVADLSLGLANWLLDIVPVLIFFCLMSIGTSLVMSLASSAKPRALLATLSIAVSFAIVIGTVDTILQSAWLQDAERDSALGTLYYHRHWISLQCKLLTFGVTIALFAVMNWFGLVAGTHRVRLLLSACCVGGVSAVVLHALPSGQYLISPHLAGGLTATGCVMIFGVRGNLGRLMLLPMVSVLTGVVTASLAPPESPWSVDAVSQSNAIVLALFTAVVLRFAGPLRLLAVAAVTWLSVTLSWQLFHTVALDGLTLSIALWFVVCGTLARHLAEQLDTNWHITERVRVAVRRLSSGRVGRVRGS